ncbi:MAG TPA: fasciclin domain-containing protein [Gemmatimonadaceae bacterium]|nr:fasciclin domain-containing protein [Gemmatimonadaceae bacterium]
MTTAPDTSGGSSETPKKTSRTSADSRAAREMPTVAERDILDTAWTLGRFNTFTIAARNAGLEELLTGDGPFTVFAPTDRAFAKLSSRERDALMANPGRMAEVLRHHVIEGKVKAPRTDEPRTATPLHGADLTITATDGVYHVGAAKLVKTNFRASNGVIHAIDTVLMDS